MGRLVLDSNRVYGPGDTGAFVTGALRNVLMGVSKPFWKEKVTLSPGYVMEFDGVSNIVDDTISRTSNAVVTYVDGNRFPKQLADAEFITVRRPTMPNQIMTKGGDLYSAVPLATDLGAVEIKMGDALYSAGFTFSANDYFKFPMYKYVIRQLVLRDVFGSNADAYFAFANRLTRHGPAETLLSALQPDAELKTLAFLSGGIPFREIVTNDEVSVLLEALELNSMTAFATLVSQANALQALRRCEIINSGDDSAGVGILLYYAMMHPAYVARLPKDVILALSNPGPDGIATISTVSGVTVKQLQVRLHESVLALVPVLRTITDATISALTRARVLYKMLCVMRLLQMRGVNPTLSYTLPEADRVKLFNLMI